MEDKNYRIKLIMITLLDVASAEKYLLFFKKEKVAIDTHTGR